ncbi:hypothetical protein MMC30_006225 [Trapelia coarctata]|nr:hypothetical protein [Trapelia coarctata]
MAAQILETLAGVFIFQLDSDSLAMALLWVGLTYMAPTTHVIISIICIAVGRIFAHMVQGSAKDADFTREVARAEVKMLRLDAANMKAEAERMDARAEMLEKMHGLLEVHREWEAGRRLG